MLNLYSLHIKDNLNDELWNERCLLKPEVRTALLDIALDFYNQLDMPWTALKDIVFAGSLSNYNWSDYSDIDLHLIVDYEDIDESDILVSNYFNTKKDLWNKQHNIKIKGYEVEIFIKNARTPYYTSGVYSILHDCWIRKPQPQSPVIDKEAVSEKARTISNFIDDTKNLLRKNDYKEAIRAAELLSKKIKKMRKTGLEDGGEYSLENLTYKVLKQNGYLEKLQNVKLDAYDKMMSMDV